ncbi:MAG TPA: DUF4097 family beta strand repeat-containing protein [Thermomicrobiales bacterium]|nr:DUF4097 family beta strand repeat-containing protein [Thermomicrobiales bacterium]
MSATDQHADEFPLHPGSLEGITRLRIDCTELDFSVEADPSLVGTIHLVVAGSSNNAPSLIREGEELIVYQRGRFRDSGNPATLLVPVENCPPISGSHEKGELLFDQVVASIALKHGSGDIRIAEGAGDISIDTGKGDVTISGREGAINVRSGMGDMRIARARGAMNVALGKGDVDLDTCDGEIDVKLGSGDINASDCSGGLAVKGGHGDVSITRPRAALLTINSGNGDITIRGGTLAGLDARTAKGDISCGSHLLFIPDAAATSSQATATVTIEPDDPNPVSRLLRSRGIEFMAGDKGLRIASGPFEFEASDAGLRIAKGKFTFEASDQGVRIINGEGEDLGELGAFQLVSANGDVSVDVPSGTPLRVEALVSGGEVRSDVPLVSVGRPGPRGSTQRFVGVTEPHAGQRLNLRVRSDRGDVRIRSVAGLPAQPNPPLPPSSPNAPTSRIPRTPRTPRVPVTPPIPPRPARPARPANPVSGITDAIAMPAPVSQPQPSREVRMRAILNALANGAITVSEADRRLAELERDA